VLALGAGALVVVAACTPAAPAGDAAVPATAKAVPSGITGVLNDEAGSPLASAHVLACMSTVCYSDRTGADGRFTFPIDAPAEVVIKTEEDIAPGWRRAAAMAPVRLTEARLVDVGDVRTPALPEGPRVGPARLDPQALDAGDGLSLTVKRAALKPPAGYAIADVAARRLPAVMLPRYAALLDEEVVAVYALHPFAATSAEPIGIRAASDLPAGTPVKFRTISEIDGSLSAPVAGTASGSFVATDPSAGITRLTYLVVSR